jgi:hypothetical protein
MYGKISSKCIKKNKLSLGPSVVEKDVDSPCQYDNDTI